MSDTQTHQFFRITKINSSRKKCFRHFGLRRNRKKKIKTQEEVMDDFRHNTTLLGIQHILRKKSIIWTIAYLCCVGMSLFQSWAVTLDFIQQKTHQKFSVQNTKILPFPSVTICNGIVLPHGFNMSLIPGYDTSVSDTLSVNTCKDEGEIDKWEAKVEENTRAIVRYRRSLTESERIKLSGGVSTFIEKCKFDGKKCEDFNDTNLFRIFNNPYYGTCITFNPAMDEASAKWTDVYARLIVDINLRKLPMQLDTRRPRAGIQIHEPGTAPILDSASVQDVYRQQSLAFTMRLTEKEFMKRYNEASCVDPTDMNYRKKSAYYNENTPYLYSVTACMRTCEQKYMRSNCNVSDATGPVAADDEIRKKDALQYGAYLATDTCSIKEDLDMKFCDCPLPCNLTQYAITVDSTELQSPKCAEAGSNKLTVPIEKADVAVYFVSNIFEKVEEELTISLSQFLGILGGNMSLWIGMCVISLLELFELSFNLTRAWFQSKKSVKAGVSTETIDPTQKGAQHAPSPPFVCVLQDNPPTSLSYADSPVTTIPGTYSSNR